LRTVVAFSAYCVAHSLAGAVQDGYRPEITLLFGGGWKNPALLLELRNLCSGKADYVLPQHKEIFALLPGAILNPDTSIKISDEVGLPSSGMEAGIFAFAAVQRIINKPFTQPSFTNCKSPTRCGAVFLPKTGQIASSLAEFNLPDERHLFKDPRLGRAAPDNQ
jgi:1,6-anhydro-N-acetylmuramate kinase